MTGTGRETTDNIASKPLGLLVHGGRSHVGPSDTFVDRGEQACRGGPAMPQLRSAQARAKPHLFACWLSWARNVLSSSGKRVTRFIAEQERRMDIACSSTWFLIVTSLSWAAIACVAVLDAASAG